jgi:ABC-2 type transport system permease protein
MNSMTMKWLLRREFWEHKGSMFWAQLVVAAVMVLFVGGSLVYGVMVHGGPTRVMINGHVVSQGALAAAMPMEARSEIAGIASGMYLAAGIPLFILMTATLFFYCLGALYDERRDRSILFWKSLPVSDGTTVLSKVVTALCVAPLITMGFAIVASLALLLIGAAVMASAGINLFGMLLSQPDLYLQPVRLLGLLPVYMVWALPTIGWLMLVSSWAKTKPFLWAVGVPLMVLLLAKWISMALGGFQHDALDVQWFGNEVVARGIGGLLPGIWFGYSGGLPVEAHRAGGGVDTQVLFTASWMTLATARAWIGALVGGAMIFGAIRLRRYRDEG